MSLFNAPFNAREEDLMRLSEPYAHGRLGARLAATRESAGYVRENLQRPAEASDGYPDTPAVAHVAPAAERTGSLAPFAA
jgi:hypothetical protein